ncbi:MAG: phage tail tape measure protein [Bacteroidales bacterium]|nr:phage tail tape measure protein [Bacteroidales bacterium]
MPGLYEYTIMMNDKASGTLQKLTGSSYDAVNKFVQLQDKTDSLKRHVADFGNGIGSLKQKIDILQGERDLIDPQNLPKIQQYNREIAGLNSQINQLETTTGGSKVGKNLKDAFQQIPGAAMLTNPIVLAGAGVAAVSKLNMSWEDGMAKINTTAQLPKEELDKLGDKIKKLGVNAGADLAKVPDAYEKIISQTGDVALSTDILATALKGAKAGYTDVDVVSGAVGQSLSAIGKGKETAAAVMDVLFAAKGVGAGEFTDFANNIPGLIAGANNVGVSFRETAGAFAYMTGKGNDASSSTMLLNNAFTALGKSEITQGLQKAGVEVYDAQGNMKGLLPIVEQLGGLMSSMNDKEKSNFLESIGLRDAQAKQAFSILTNETDKLREAMDATANATGEMAAALDKVNTPGNKIKEIWSNITGAGLGLGDMINAVLNPILDVLLGMFQGVFWIVTSVGTAWAWWSGLIQESNPWIIGLTTLLGGLATVLAINYVWAQKEAIMTGISTAAKWVYTTATAVLTGATWAQVAAQWGLNTALLASPITWVAVGVMALVAAFVAAWRGSEKFRAVMTGVGEVLKGVGGMLFTLVIAPIKNVISGLGAVGTMIGKLFKKDFAGAAQSGKEALMSFTGANTAKELWNKGKGLGEKFNNGYKDGSGEFKKDKWKKGFEKDKETGKWVKKKEDEETLDLKVAPKVDESAFNNDDLMSKFDKTKKGKSPAGKKDDSLSLGIPQDYNQTGLYSAINQKFGVQADLAMNAPGENKPENPTEKPVINMSTRVDEIAGSLRRMAAAAALPIALTLGAGQASAMQPLNVPDWNQTITQPVANLPGDGKNLFNAFDNSVANESYDNSTLTTNEITNNRTEEIHRVSATNNTNQGKSIRIDRFTDKIEIHIHGTDAQTGQAVAQNVRDEVEKALAEILNV